MAEATAQEPFACGSEALREVEAIQVRRPLRFGLKGSQGQAMDSDPHTLTRTFRVGVRFETFNPKLPLLTLNHRPPPRNVNFQALEPPFPNPYPKTTITLGSLPYEA